MTFGDPSDFAVEAESDGTPASPRGTVWGHMRVWCCGRAVGRFEEPHCGLSGAQLELSEIADRLDLLVSPALSKLTDESAWNFLDTALYVDDVRSDEDVELDAEAWGRHSFLTNSSEAFDGYKGFIFRRDPDSLRILIKGSDELLLAFTVTAAGIGGPGFRTVVQSNCGRLELTRVSSNKQLERTVIRRHVRAASASLHSAHAARYTAQRAAAQLRR
jgi:hypothetical protein